MPETSLSPAIKGIAAGMLQLALANIEEYDTDYPTRYTHVLQALDWAHQAGLKAGIGFDPAEPEWPVVYIELPTGQVSWHMPAHPVPYDGHSTPEKYERVRAYLGQDVLPGPHPHTF
jgi:hypothetical protein